MAGADTYDIIICGAGCAGLSLAYRLCDPAFAHLRVLILEGSSKVHNDRTWSSWQLRSKLLFPDIHHKRWDKLFFASSTLEQIFPLNQYVYCTIRGIDFYQYTLQEIRQCDHMEIVYERVDEIVAYDDFSEVKTLGSVYRGRRVFDSIVRRFPVEAELFVWQHFKGWLIETEEDTIDDTVATLMDFRIPQHGETRFVYVLPFSTRQAFVEATVFGKELPDASFYDAILQEYIRDHLKIARYQVIESEHGKIPMTTAKFADWHPRKIPIGTNAMTVKPSSGYAFVRIQEEAEELIQQVTSGKYQPLRRNSRFLKYDKTLLHVAIQGRETLDSVFTTMFKHSPTDRILRFLDEKTDLREELKIFSKMPKRSFLRAFLEENVLK